MDPLEASFVYWDFFNPRRYRSLGEEAVQVEAATEERHEPVDESS